MRYILIYISILINVNFIYSQDNFQKVLATDEWDLGLDIIQTENSDIVVTGYTQGIGAGYRDIFITRLTNTGDALWTKTYGGVLDGDFGRSVIETTNNDLIIVGTTCSYGSGEFDIFVIKTNENGETIWTKTYGTNLSEHAYTVKESNDGFYVISGYIENDNIDYDIFILKIDTIGNLIFSKQYGDEFREYGYDMSLTDDNGIIVVGSRTDEITSYERNLYILKTDSNGNLEWTKTYRGSSVSEATAIAKSDNGSYIISGFIATAVSNGYLIRIDSSGNKVWSRNFGGDLEDKFLDVAITTDGGFIATGYSRDFGPGIYNIYMVKTDAYGDTLWTSILSHSEIDICYSIIETDDGGFCLTGCTYIPNFGEYAISILKIDNEGNGSCNNYCTSTISYNISEVQGSGGVENLYVCSTTYVQPIEGNKFLIDSNLCEIVNLQYLKENESVMLYPNPSNSIIYLSLSEQEIEQITLYNIHGNEIKKYTGVNSFSVGSLRNGVYLIRILDKNNNMYINKFIKNN